MVGALTAAGLMGGLAMVLAQLSRQQLVLQKRSQSQSEVEAISRRIGRILNNPQACLNTVSSATFGSGLTTNSTITLASIKNQSNVDVYATNQTYGNGLVKISSLILRDIRFSGSTGVNTELQVTLEKTSRAVTGYKKAVRTYDLVIQINPLMPLPSGGTPTACETDLSAAKAAICQELGRNYDGSTGTCDPFTAGKTCASANDLPVGFDGAGDLVCVTPAAGTLPHPTGFNCFLLALHSGDHGGSGTFQRRNIDIGGVLYPAVINTEAPYIASPQPRRIRLVALLDRWTPTGSVSPTCPSDYTPLYINPIGRIPDHNNMPGAKYAYIQHYCCK